MPYFMCKCGNADFLVSFEYKEPLTISDAVQLKCLNKKCGMVHRVRTNTEWKRDFPQRSLEVDRYFEKR